MFLTYYLINCKMLLRKLVCQNGPTRYVGIKYARIVSLASFDECTFVKMFSFCVIIVQSIYYLGISHQLPNKNHLGGFFMFSSYSNTPIILEAGCSHTAKSYLQEKMVNEDFSKGMDLMTGEGSTTNYQAETIIDPNIDSACVSVSLMSEDELRVKLIKNLRVILIKECRNVIASLPENDDKAIADFLDKAAVERAEFDDPTFRIQVLLIHKKEKLYEYLKLIFTPAVKAASNLEFRNSYRETAREDKNKASNMIEMLIENKLFVTDEQETDTVYMEVSDKNEMFQCKEAFDKLIDLIISERDTILKENGFQVKDNNASEENLSPEKFYHVMSHLTNSVKKRPVEAESIACCINEMTILVPGEGIIVNSRKTPYRMIDIVGFDNEGSGDEEVDRRIKQAMLTKYSYDCIIYFASKKLTNKNHERYLLNILNSMRPAKLVIASTFMEDDSIFKEDEYPDQASVESINESRKIELQKLIKNLVPPDTHIILPEKEDIICIAKASTKQCGEAAVRVYQGQFDNLRFALGRGVEISRRKISLGVEKGVSFLCLNDDIDHNIGSIVNELGNIINNEYMSMRSDSSYIHHWTLDAMLWHFLRGENYSSRAKVWKNVNVLTYTNLEKVCRDYMGDFHFSQEVSIAKEEDRERIISIFEANLRTEIYYVVRKLILRDPETSQMSKYGEFIKKLALTSKYNKWKIVDDFRKCLLSAIANSEYLKRMLISAIDQAIKNTYDQVCY